MGSAASSQPKVEETGQTTPKPIPIPTSAEIDLALKHLGVPERDVKAACESAWKETDKDNSGFVEKAELSKCLERVFKEIQGVQPDITIPAKEQREAGVTDAMKDLDTNKNGKLERDEFDVFVKMMLIMVKTMADVS
mmetsp:Transcript_43896/g.70578  ORF Transcript_43896/g.70578 Transcript_43896/m.70578 type:complete len:137 (+) Transcript_43896:111-521(+)